ncbi:hypothetical protein ACEZDB_37900 [Streptacidiphilus sp. N1-3]|uniref:SnoaL-like domain-containing protein n=1 Tax=Streptacidiphilus alkalitolerans TaxID=3342712 RepID=A0ABV6XES1_9ACTN
MNESTAHELAGKFITFLETGDPPEGLFRPDVFCDFTPPQWRLQSTGAEELVQTRRRSHPAKGAVPRWRCDPTPTGFVLEVEERWTDTDDHWYCRELFRADVTEGAISDLSVYCTGDWNSAQQERHRSEVTLLRP